MALKIVTAKAHADQLENKALAKEIEDLGKQLYKIEDKLNEGSINFVFVKGVYLHIDRKMYTVCLFVNETGKAIKELHGVLRMKFMNKKALAAKSTVNFDEDFMGVINNDEALLIHIPVPVKGLYEDEDFTVSDFDISFSEVRITPA